MTALAPYLNEFARIPTVQAKLLRLEELHDGRYVVLRGTMDTEDAAYQAVVRAEDEVRRIDNHPHRKQSTEQLQRAKEALDGKRSLLALARERHERAKVEWEGCPNPIRLIDVLPSSLRHGNGIHCAVSIPKNIAGGYAAAVAQLRANDLAANAAEAERIEPSPATVEEHIAAMTAAVDAEAAKGAPSYNPRNRDGDPFRFRDSLRFHQQGTMWIGDAGASFFTWLMRDAIVERLSAIILATPRTGAMTEAERKKALSSLAARRLELERREEALICAAEQVGQFIARRPDASPAAILELAERRS